MDNQAIYGPMDSGKVISPEWAAIEALKKGISKYGVPTGIYIDTGKEFIRVFGEGEECVKVRARRALLEQIDILQEHAKNPDDTESPSDLARAMVTVVEALNRMEMSNQMEGMLKKLNDMGLGL